jgi:thermostable 8-oxoguanine DNA glycosylase
MVDPRNITRFDRTTAELEELMLFCVAVGGKTARVIAQALEEFLTAHPGSSPFDTIRRLQRDGGLDSAIRASRLGKHARLARAYAELVDGDFDLRVCSVDELETIHGIGPKTSRFFILHTRPNQQLAVLDTHILRYMRSRGFRNIPAATPTGRRYKEIEAKFLALAAREGRDPAEFDLAIWRDGSR